MALGEAEGLHHRRRLLLEEVLAGHPQLAAQDEETVVDRAPFQIADDAQPRFLLRGRLGDQDRGHVLDLGGVGVVILHELFDRRGLAAVVVAEEGRDLFLLVEVDLFVLARREEMQLVADPPEIVEGGFKVRLLRARSAPP